MFRLSLTRLSCSSRTEKRTFSIVPSACSRRDTRSCLRGQSANWPFSLSSSVVRYPRYLDTYRQYLRDDTSIAKDGHDILRYIVAVQNTVRWRKYREYRRYRAARTTLQRARYKPVMLKRIVKSQKITIITVQQ